MELLTAAERLAALGHEYRLAIFRLLVQAGPSGLHASAIGDALGLAPNTLSFHLAHLSRVGLIEGQRESRFILYRASFGAMGGLLAFLTENCCQGEPCLPATANAAAACTPACSPSPAAAAPRGATPARRLRRVRT
jgi:DNA-binding transcriptional ArsR family regulator